MDFRNILRLVTKGDKEGHEFHGNQYKTVDATEDVSYRRDHSAPSNDGFCAPLHALDQIYPPDIYSDKALRYYGSGGDDKADGESLKVINAVKGNPDAMVTIYRGVPKDVDTINTGDWVTLSKTYAENHAEGNVVGGGKVISMTVPAKTVFTNADSINEFGYDPTTGVSKGDVEGHAFHGNQYTIIDGVSHKVYWHGSPNGKAGLKVANYGVHVGGYLAAKEALEARIGKRADGKDWNGDQEYGKTMIVGGDGKPRLPEPAYYLHPVKDESGKWITDGNKYTWEQVQQIKSENPNWAYNSRGAIYSDGSPIPMDSKPNLFPVAITGSMKNTPLAPISDDRANSTMTRNLSAGNAKNGYYYSNEGEGVTVDANGNLVNDISAVVPSAEHLTVIPKEQVVAKGDKTGHEFHGNQWTGGKGGNTYLAKGASDYAKLHGINRPDIDYSRVQVNPERAKAIANEYVGLPSLDESARPAYRQFAKETHQQFEYLTKTLGIKVDVVKDDPYKNEQEMAQDILDNHHLSVLSADSTGGHPFVSNREIEEFRAVHDAFGHAATGRDFDRHGEEAAWASHSTMYSPLASLAMTTATRGQNSVMTQLGGGFPEQKGALLSPQWADPSTLSFTDGVSKSMDDIRPCFGGGRAQYDYQHSLINKGDKVGHAFHGNQYKEGESGEPTVSPELRQRVRDFAEGFVPSQFVETYTNNLSKILASPERYEKLRAELVAGGDNSFGGADITAIAMLGGANGVPKVVSNSAFSKIDSPVLYQGLTSGTEINNPGANRPAEGVTAENMVANFAYNPVPHFGGGDYGIAYYTSQEPSVSGQYANGEDNAMLRMKLLPDAIIMNYDRAERTFDYNQDGVKQLLADAGFKNFDVKGNRETSWYLSTMNTTAMLCGVSALTRDTPYGQYTMVLDRSQVSVANTYTKIDPSYWDTAGTTTTGVYDSTPLLDPKDFGANGATGKNPLITNAKIDQTLTKALVQKGDVKGHVFHGNQWIDAEGNFNPNGNRKPRAPKSQSPKANRISRLASSVKDGAKEGKFVALKDNLVAKVIGNKLKLGGAFNEGWQKVEMKDGTLAGVKTIAGADVNDGDPANTTQAQNEVLASAVGKALDIPIRDAQFVPAMGAIDANPPNDAPADQPWLSRKIVSPWIDGKSGYETKIPDTPEAQADLNKIQFFDQLVGNGDRFMDGELFNHGNIMVTTNGSLVGIDHSFAFPEKGSDFYNSIPVPDFNLLGSPTREELEGIHASLMALKPTFTSMNRTESFGEMLARFQTGAITYMSNKGMI